MVQREVAERITAKVGDLSYLAVAVQSAARARIIRLVPPGAFHPRPRVESMMADPAFAGGENCRRCWYARWKYSPISRTLCARPTMRIAGT